MKRRKTARVARITPAGDHHQVLTLRGGGAGYQERPCAQCPWRVDATGVFPPEAFLASVHTSYDAALEQFACHSSVQIVDAVEGTERTAPRTCAGFLLRGATHNLGARLLGDKPVGHAVDEEVARLFIRGWAARLGLRRRLAPPSMLGRDRKAWRRGWDHANERQRRVVAA